MRSVREAIFRHAEEPGEGREPPDPDAHGQDVEGVGRDGRERGGFDGRGVAGEGAGADGARRQERAFEIEREPVRGRPPGRREEREGGQEQEETLADEPHGAEEGGAERPPERLGIEHGARPPLEARRLEREGPEARRQRDQYADAREAERLPLPALRRGR